MAIEALDLVFEELEPLNDGSCEPGTVIQSPAPETEVEVGSTVTYRVCEAPATASPSATPTSTPIMSSSPNPLASASPTAG